MHLLRNEKIFLYNMETIMHFVFNEFLVERKYNNTTYTWFFVFRSHNVWINTKTNSYYINSKCSIKYYQENLIMYVYQITCLYIKWFTRQINYYVQQKPVSTQLHRGNTIIFWMLKQYINILKMKRKHCIYHKFLTFFLLEIV